MLIPLMYVVVFATISLSLSLLATDARILDRFKRRVHEVE
jgi:hypothetical protein